MFPYEQKHAYTLAATGIKFKGGEFSSRESAKREMYAFIDKKGLQVINKYDDHHFKTYICTNGVKFYINRI